MQPLTLFQVKEQGLYLVQKFSSRKNIICHVLTLGLFFFFNIIKGSLPHLRKTHFNTLFRKVLILPFQHKVLLQIVCHISLHISLFCGLWNLHALKQIVWEYLLVHVFPSLPYQFPYLTFLPISDNAMHTVHPGV